MPVLASIIGVVRYCFGGKRVFFIRSSQCWFTIHIMHLV